MKSVMQFMSEVRTELGRVEWPTFHEFLGSSMVVLFLVLMFSIYLYLVDSAISVVIRKIFAYSM